MNSQGTSLSVLKRILQQANDLVARKKALLSGYRKKLEEREIEELKQKISLSNPNSHE